MAFAKMTLTPFLHRTQCTNPGVDGSISWWRGDVMATASAIERPASVGDFLTRVCEIPDLWVSSLSLDARRTAVLRPAEPQYFNPPYRGG